MATTRRTNIPPRKRPATAGVVRANTIAAKDSNAEREQIEERSSKDGRAEIVAELEDALRQHSEIDAETLDALLPALRDVIESTPTTPALAAPDPAAWRETIQSLSKDGVLSEEDAAALSKRVDEVFGALASSDLKVALEFARRLDDDGQESALNWLVEQQQVQAEDVKQNSEGQDGNAAGWATKQSDKRSRSRRLRGPPK